jgi:hypothetical protein
MAALFVVAALVFGTGALSYDPQAERPDAPAAAQVQPPAAAQPAAPPAKDAEAPKKPAITGRILDADGKPIKGALVAAAVGLDLGRLSVEARWKRLDEVKTDDEGRFRMPLPDGIGRVDRVELLAGAKGYGPGWSRSGGAGKDIELRLPPEDAVVGRLIDLQGQPVGRAKLRPRRVLVAPQRDPKVPGPKENNRDTSEMRHRLALERRSKSFEFWKSSPVLDCPLWPQPVTTDADGRFRVSGFGRGQEVDLLVEDDRVAAQEVSVVVGDKERNFGLEPPHKVSGRITAADTNKPLAGASVWVTSSRDRLGYGVDVRADADGRYSANAYPGESYSVAAYPPDGEPYLATVQSSPWPKGSVKQEVNLALPRGAVVRGKVVEAGSGKSIDSVSLVFVSQRENNPDLPRVGLANQGWKHFTGADGSVRMVLPPGPGHLLVTGPNPDYVYRTTTEEALRTGKPGGPPVHAHAVLPITLHTKDAPKEVTIELRRAVTLKAQVVGPDGKTVKDAIVFVPSELLTPPQGTVMFAGFGLPIGTRVSAVATNDGAFELPYCDPEKTYRVFVMSGRAGNVTIHGLEGSPRILTGGLKDVDLVSFLNRLIAEKDVLGAVADLSAKKAGAKPVEVKLAKCETAEVRVLDAKGKAVKHKVWLELLVTPGPSLAKSREEGKPAAETVFLATPYAVRGEKSPVAPDADGKITIPGLIPGATYRLTAMTGLEGMENEIVFEKDFTAEAGKKTKLDLVAPK